MKIRKVSDDELKEIMRECMSEEAERWGGIMFKFRDTYGLTLNTMVEELEKYQKTQEYRDKIETLTALKLMEEDDGKS